MSFSRHNPLQPYDDRFPGLLDFYSRLLGRNYEACPTRYPEVARRMAQALEKLGTQETLNAFQAFQEAGLFEEGAVVGREQVNVFWGSPLMAAFQAAIAYQPTSDTNLREHMPQPVTSILELLRRYYSIGQRTREGEIAKGSLTYWQAILQTSCLELYLLPFIPLRPDRFLRGLDVGAGWGRASLGMYNIEQLEMNCVDISDQQLGLLQTLAENMEFKGRINCLEARAENLPLPDEHFDFAVSYQFLYLLEKEDFSTTLCEILRCLKPRTPVHVELPISSPMGVTTVSDLTVQELIDRFHETYAHNKTFQLCAHDPRAPNLFTFAVLPASDLPSTPRRGREAFRHKPKAKRLLFAATGRGVSSAWDRKTGNGSRFGS